jgi:putative inorganic carbon (HCO3(-)) transporter
MLIVKSKNYQKCLDIGVLALLLALPLIFDIRTLNVFEFNKIIWFRIGVEVLFFIWAAKLIFTFDNWSNFCGEIINLLKKSPADLLIVGIFGITTLATIFSIFPRISWWGTYERWFGLFTLLHVFVFYFLLRITLRRQQIFKMLLDGVAVVTFFISVYAILQHFGIDLPGFKEGLRVATPGWPRRSFATLGHPNFLGAYLALVLPLVVYSLLVSKNIYKRIFNAVTLIVGLIATVFTLSRSVWLAVTISLVVLAIILIKDKFHFTKNRILFFVVTLFVLVAGYFFINHSANNNSVLTKRLVSAFNIQNDSGGVRLWIWGVALNHVVTKPLFGYGPDTFYLLAEKTPSPFNFEPQPFDRAHNIFLDTALSVGVVATFLLLALMVYIIYYLWNARRAATETELNIYYSALLASLIAYIIIGLFNFDTITSLVYFYLVIALTLSVNKSEELPISTESNYKNYNWRYFLVVLCSILTAVLLYKNISSWQADAYAGSGSRAIAVGQVKLAEHEFGVAVTYNPVESVYRSLWAGSYIIDISDETDIKLVLDKIKLSLGYFNIAKVQGLPKTNYYQALLQLYTYWIILDGNQLPVLLSIYQAAEPYLFNRSDFYRNWGIVLYETGSVAEAKIKFNNYLKLLKGKPDEIVKPYLQNFNLP